jgi:hypothetical protein
MSNVVLEQLTPEQKGEQHSTIQNVVPENYKTKIVSFVSVKLELLLES